MTNLTTLNVTPPARPLPADTVETLDFEPIKGYPMLQWRGKRPFTSTHFYPAQLKEQHGSDVDGWLNKIYWGDNMQVMGHLLKHYRSKVQLVYIDPPFDSAADYSRRIRLHGRELANDATAFEEKQYTDIWNNDEYLQFIYERLILVKELLSDKGNIIVHCDWNKVHQIRCILEEIFGPDSIVNEIIWKHAVIGAGRGIYRRLPKAHESLLWFRKDNGYTFNTDDKSVRVPYKDRITKHLSKDERGYYYTRGRTGTDNIWSRDPRYLRTYVDIDKGKLVHDVWEDITTYRAQGAEYLGYPTQKPEKLISRVIALGSNPGDLVLDAFMGSGTTQAVAMKLGRRFLGADINLGAIQTTTKRLIGIADAIENPTAPRKIIEKPPTLPIDDELIDALDGEETEAIEEVAPEAAKFYTGFEVYNVNNYEIFRNPVEAKDLLIEALELQKLSAGHLFDGERDGGMWKIMPVNKIATRQDLYELITGLKITALTTRLEDAPGQPAEKITLVCMGHEPDLAATLNNEVALNMGIKAGTKIPLDVQVLDILRDRGDLQFKRDSEARIRVIGKELVIEKFYPMNLLAKLSLEQEKVGDWREMADSVMIDFNYDGAVFSPALVDIPEKNELVTGRYAVPADAGTIRVKITDVLSESLEMTV